MENITNIPVHPIQTKSVTNTCDCNAKIQPQVFATN